MLDKKGPLCCSIQRDPTLTWGFLFSHWFFDEMKSILIDFVGNFVYFTNGFSTKFRLQNTFRRRNALARFDFHPFGDEISSVALTVFGRNFVSFLIHSAISYTKFRLPSRFVYETGSGDSKRLEDEISMDEIRLRGRRRISSTKRDFVDEISSTKREFRLRNQNFVYEIRLGDEISYTKLIRKIS